jgi:hypothetical protein
MRGLIVMTHKFLAATLGAALAILASITVILSGESKTDATPAMDRFEIGVNAGPPRWYSRNRVYANLVLGNPWQQWEPQDPRWKEVAKTDLDADGWIKTAPPGRKIFRSLNHPIFAPGKTRVVCVYDGSAQVGISPSASVTSMSNSLGKLSFDWRVKKAWPEGIDELDNIYLVIQNIDPANPIRNIDCREQALDPAARFSPAFIAAHKGFSVVRYLGLQHTNHNEAVTLETRKHVTSTILPDEGGVPIEDIILLSNLTNTSPWICLPWNADEAFIRNFAIMLRDGLNPNLQAYVEMSNEVWNPGFSVARQARREGIAAQLSDKPFEAQLKRYAQRAVEGLKIWTDVFSGKNDRLVRVVSAQHANPHTARIVMSFPGVSEYSDALATAPYFGHELEKMPDSLTAEEAFPLLDTALDVTISQMRQNEAIARQFGKRYIAYEGGQHVVLPRNVPLLRQINRDPRMGALYTKLLINWRDIAGDLFVHIGDVAPTSRFGAWGFFEYQGQPVDEAPKGKAVQAFLKK